MGSNPIRPAIKGISLEPLKLIKRKAQNYVDPKKLLEDMILYKKSIKVFEKETKEARKNGNPLPEKPRVSEYVGKCILDIAERLSRKPQFSAYPFRDDMVGYGIENVLTYIDNFNPFPKKSVSFWTDKVNHDTGKKYTKKESLEKIKSKKPANPFAYFTQIIYWAFLRKIAYEKKQLVIKYKMIQNSPFFQDLSQQAGDDGVHHNAYIRFLQKNMGDIVSDFEAKKKEKKDKARKKNNLEKLL